MLKASEQTRPDVVQAREEWKEFQGDVCWERLVFLDESSAKTNMIQYYGRAPRGERCFDSAPCGHWNTTTMLSSIRLDGNTECVVFRGALNRDLFESYVEHVLAPSLRPGDIVIMDNLRAHQSSEVIEFIHARQAEVRFLPSYSPDLNPIEKMWSKVKQLLRVLKARTEDALFEAIGTALCLVTADDARGWFRSCGYGHA